MGRVEVGNGQGHRGRSEQGGGGRAPGWRGRGRIWRSVMAGHGEGIAEARAPVQGVGVCRS